MLPHVPDAWADHTKTKIGYEILLNRHFYGYEPPRPLDDVIDADLHELETRHHPNCSQRSPRETSRTPAIGHSGVEWLGNVPEHWQDAQVRLRFRIVIMGEQLASGIPVRSDTARQSG